jgi:H/ACA ribonucleoprotein complex subunit 4
VTGVLPIALEDATKALQVFLHSGKEYVCLMQLHGDVPEEKIINILKEFTGEIYQKPPLRASVKREVRKRKIYNIEVLEIEDRKVLFKVSCQAGTYIRKLCFDIGEALKVGAHMKELRRIRTGPFTENEKNYTLHQVFEAAMEYKNFGNEEKLRKVIRPIEECFEYIPKIYIKDSAVDAICHGAYLTIPGIAKLDSNIQPKQMVAIFTLKNEAVALGNALLSTEQILELNKGLAVEIKRVIMRPGTYPKLWKSK